MGARVLGTKNGQSKLDPDKVRELRRLRQETTITLKALAKQFGLSVTAVAQCTSGETWGWLD